MDGYAIATLVIFILSICFVIRPVLIPTHVRSIPRVPLNLTTAPILAIAILWASQCIDADVIRNGIVGTGGVKPYNILILFFSLAYMAITLDTTGILEAAAFWVSNKGGSNGRKSYFYFYVMLTLLSILLGNDPVILSGTAFLAYYTTAAGVKPMPWLMSEFAAANTASMVLFVGNPTNVVICEGFSVNNAAFTAYTILPFIACNILCFGALAGQYHSDQHVPHKLDKKADVDPRSALHNVTGAWVGSIILGSALIVCLVVSFFGIDVWEISLPFAVTKFIFDLASDHYRFTRCKVPDTEKAPTTETPNHERQNQHSVGLTSLSESQSTAGETTLEKTMNGSTPLPLDNTVQTTPKSPAPQTFVPRVRSQLSTLNASLHRHFPTFFTALPRLPFALVPFAFSQFILIQALAHQGWVTIFADWLVKATNKQMYPTIWLVGVLGVILCNVAGTNIGATILLTKIVNAAAFPPHSARAAAIALAVASNIGAVSFTFSASLAGLLWKDILAQKKIFVKQREFAYWNCLPLLVMTVTGLAVVCAEMAVLYQSSGA
ncbi:hypothetical protein EDD16DRAFT_1690090 [Pisolithus croceorrhizus]|nr:hypothetical protein EDD16DRAFT_1690090 [Pisolithus croceorrhizus]KAI6135839.1 hypothetical protein EV401DRAFT_2052242 [Pisolithus croceorrhizus]KAI6169584.1 hypothetical protein EDD17DRAFT_1748729 [Pisolithus thermaeus]